jgi:MADS-box transcription factor
MQSSNGGNIGAGTAGNSNLGSTQMSGLAKRKSPDLEVTGHDESHETAGDPKRLKVER